MTIRSPVNKNVLSKTIARDPNMESQSIEMTNTGDPITGANVKNEEHTEASWDALTAVEQNSPVHSHEHWDGTTVKR